MRYTRLSQLFGGAVVAFDSANLALFQIVLKQRSATLRSSLNLIFQSREHKTTKNVLKQSSIPPFTADGVPPFV